MGFAKQHGMYDDMHLLSCVTWMSSGNCFGDNGETINITGISSNNYTIKIEAIIKKNLSSHTTDFHFVTSMYSFS